MNDTGYTAQEASETRQYIATKYTSDVSQLPALFLSPLNDAFPNALVV